jgi:hypothetical protein
VGIVYDERTFLQSFRDQGALSIRIIVNDSNVRERKIQELQIGEASPIAPDDYIVGDAMSAFPHAPRYPIKRRLGRRQPQIYQRQPPAIGFAPS